MPLPFDTSEYDDYENPAPVIKVGGLSAQDATDPYAIYQKQALEANAAKWKAKTEALQAARLEAPDKMERITQALLAFGAPTHGNNWAALSNATKALSMSGAEADQAQRERTNQLAQLRAQQEDAAAAIKEKYGFAGAQAQQAVALKKADAENKPMTKDRQYVELSNILSSGGTLTAGQQKVWDALNPLSSSDVVANVMDKVARGEELTPGEMRIAKSKIDRAPPKPSTAKATGISPAVDAAAKAGIRITG